MKLIHTNDNTHYRRWINLIPSLLLPGSAQFLSGLKARGIAWFALYFFIFGAMIVFLIHPKTSYSVLQMGPFDWILLPFWLLIAGDGLRRSIPRMGFRSWLLFLLVCLGIPMMSVLTVRTFLVQPFNVPTGGMQPTIMGNRKDAEGNQIPGDRIFVNKLIYRLSEPHRGDVIVFNTKGIESLKLDTCYVKRLVGLPGETVGIESPYLVVNSNRVTKPAIFSRIAERQNGFSGFSLATSSSAFAATLASPSDKITLGPDEYLVLGDNTRSSLDGRYFGPIKRSSIIGKAVYIYAPANRKQGIE